MFIYNSGMYPSIWSDTFNTNEWLYNNLDGTNVPNWFRNFVSHDSLLRRMAQLLARHGALANSFTKELRDIHTRIDKLSDRMDGLEKDLGDLRNDFEIFKKEVYTKFGDLRELVDDNTNSINQLRTTMNTIIETISKHDGLIKENIRQIDLIWEELRKPKEIKADNPVDVFTGEPTKVAKGLSDALMRLPDANEGYVLRIVDGKPVWAPPPAGGKTYPDPVVPKGAGNELRIMVDNPTPQGVLIKGNPEENTIKLSYRNSSGEDVNKDVKSDGEYQNLRFLIDEPVDFKKPIVITNGTSVYGIKTAGRDDCLVSVLDYPKDIRELRLGNSKLEKVPDWLPPSVKSLDNIFSDTRVFNQDLSGWNTKNVTTMNNAFYNSKFDNNTICDWFMGNVTSVAGMFRSASFNQDLSRWDSSSFKDVSSMFSNNTKFNSPLFKDVSKVTSFNEMFFCQLLGPDPKFNQTITWDEFAPNVTLNGMFDGSQSFNNGANKGAYSPPLFPNIKPSSMRKVFRWCKAFNGDVSSWQTGAVNDLTAVFEFCGNFKGDLGRWDTRNVVSMEGAFSDSFIDSNIGMWNVSKCENFNGVFRSSYVNADISRWDVRSAKTMEEMFANATFNSEIDRWDVSNVTNMGRMFGYCKRFNQDLSSWKPKVKDKPPMFDIQAKNWKRVSESNSGRPYNWPPYSEEEKKA